MERPKDPEQWSSGEKAWYANAHDEARCLFQEAVESAAEGSYALPPTGYLTHWAYLEATLKNRSGFEALYQRAFALEPAAPFIKLSYARVLWTEFKDGVACATAIGELQSLLRSDQWRREGDLSLRAYEEKIDTLKAWMRGEPGGLAP